MQDKQLFGVYRFGPVYLLILFVLCVRQICAALQSVVYDRWALNQDKFEVYTLRNIIEVPEHIDVNDKIATQEELKQESDQLDQQLRELYKKVDQARKLKQSLTSQLAELEIDQQVYEQAAELFDATDEENKGTLLNYVQSIQVASRY